jgi:drug/metabolite transporter (DMT)-like permease
LTARLQSLWLPFLVVTLIWGSTWYAIKLQLTQVAPAWSVTYRFVGAALVLAVIIASRRKVPSLSMQQHMLLCVQGILQFCLNFMLVYEAEHYIPSGLLAICYALMVLTNPLAARFILGQRLAKSALIGGSIAIVGVVLMFLPEIKHISWGDTATRGLLLTLGGVVAATFGNQIAGVKAMKSVDPATMMLWAMAYGATASALWASRSAGPPHISLDQQYLLALAFLILLGSCLSFTLYFGMLKLFCASGGAGLVHPV